MARLKGMKPTRVRYTVEISEKIDSRLVEIAERRDMSKADLIRTAAHLIAEWDRLEQNGFAFGGWKPNESGGLETERLLPIA